jgi:PAS domain S-box-containing protein
MTKDKAHNAPQTLRDIQSETLDAALKIFLVGGFFFVLAATLEEWTAGARLRPVFYCVLYGSVALATRWKRLGFSVRSTVFLSFLYFWGLSELWSFGLASMGGAFLLSFVVFSSAFFRYRAVVIASAASILTYGIVAWLYVTGVRAIIHSQQEVSTVWQNWLTCILLFFFLSFLCLYFISLLLRRLESSRLATQQLVGKLKEEVHERKKIAEILHQNENRYALMAENASETIIELDEAGSVTFVTPSVARVLGWQAKEMVGINIVEFIKAGVGRMPAPEVAGQLIEGQMARFSDDVELRCKDGATTWCEVHAFALFDIGSRKAKICVLARDVSSRKELEEQLLQSRKMEAIGALAGGIAHDFNNLLAGIMGAADLLGLDGKQGGAQKEATQTILDCAHRASGLTKELLNFARKGKSVAVPVDMHQLLDKMVQILSHTLDRRIVLEQDYAAKEFIVMGDPNQLQSALMNLCLNARDAMPDGGRLCLATEIQVPEESCFQRHADMLPGPYFMVRVIDTGHGIPEGLQKRVVEPFFTTKPFGQGTGLGLSGVAGCVASHYGAMHLSSTVDEGTSFSIYLPLAIETAEESPVSEKPVSLGAGETILVVDDEKMVREVVCRILAHQGYRALPQANPHDALAYLQKHAADIQLVLLDMNMPEMTGIELVRAMRDRSIILPVLLFTGYINEDARQALHSREIIDIIEKPIRRDALLNAIEKALHAPKQR